MAAIKSKLEEKIRVRGDSYSEKISPFSMIRNEEFGFQEGRERCGKKG